MLNIATMEKFDPMGMHKTYDLWPQLSRDAYNSDLTPVNFENIEHVVFAGMGGSGAIGDLFLSVLSKTSIHVTVVKGYLLPKTVNSKTLLVATSVSGNTIETLTIVESAKNLDCEIICFSGGGKLGEFCKKNNLHHRKIPLFTNPRSTFPVYVYSILKILKSILPVATNEIENSFSQMEYLSKKISTNNLTKSNPSLSLAKWLNSIPVIYYPWGLQATAIRFKNSIQENMKFPAMIEDVIEACHNGIVSWEGKYDVSPILIRGSDDYVKTKERWEILKKFFNENNIDFWEITSVNGGVLSKIINLIYLLDFSTIYRAVMNEIDPCPVKSIDYVKSNL